MRHTLDNFVVPEITLHQQSCIVVDDENRAIISRADFRGDTENLDYVADLSSVFCLVAFRILSYLIQKDKTLLSIIISFLS